MCLAASRLSYYTLGPVACGPLWTSDAVSTCPVSTDISTADATTDSPLACCLACFDEYCAMRFFPQLHPTVTLRSRCRTVLAAHSESPPAELEARASAAPRPTRESPHRTRQSRCRW